MVASAVTTISAASKFLPRVYRQLLHMNGPDSERAEKTRIAEAHDKLDVTWRLRFLQGALLFSFAALVAALGYAQLRRVDEYNALERRQNLRRQMVPGPRGAIYDREHRVLATNRLNTAAVVDLGQLREQFREEQHALVTGAHSTADRQSAVEAQARRIVVQRQLDRIGTVLRRQIQMNAARLERHFARERTTPFVLADDLTKDESERLRAAFGPSDPIQLNQSHQRWYPYGNTAAHVLGMVRRELILTPKGVDFPILNYFDWVGDSGLEKQYETRLRAQPGSTVVRVDASGFATHPPLERHEATPGDELVLSLDIDVQLAAERAMAATRGVPRGAAVAIAVATGEVLAMASKPDFDPNQVSPTLTVAMKQRIDAEGGWLNRATQGLYAPGSSFKVFTTLSGLRAGTLRPDHTFQCDGFYEVEGHRFACHNASGHGAVSLRSGLAHSCNVFAYRTGLTAGPNALAAEARRFHFHELTGVDLPSESQRMLVPDPAWKESSQRERWTTGDTVNLSIGQGFLRYSPLQAACAIASLARRETLTVPTLLHQPGRRPSGDRPREPLELSDADYSALINGLRAVIETGIGRDAQVPGISIAGKTGTAQAMTDEGMMNVAWFIAFAPVEQPEIAVAVAMEGDQPDVEFAGAQHAAPIVREMIGAYFDKRPNR